MTEAQLLRMLVRWGLFFFVVGFLLGYVLHR